MRLIEPKECTVCPVPLFVSSAHPPPFISLSPLCLSCPRSFGIECDGCGEYFFGKRRLLTAGGVFRGPRAPFVQPGDTYEA